MTPPTKTQKSNMVNPFTMDLLPDDVVLYIKVDDIQNPTRFGYIHTNKREYGGHNATVLIGKLDVKQISGIRKIRVDHPDKMFFCEIHETGSLTKIPKEYSKKDVTVIVHMGIPKKL